MPGAGVRGAAASGSAFVLESLEPRVLFSLAGAEGVTVWGPEPEPGFQLTALAATMLEARVNQSAALQPRIAESALPQVITADGAVGTVTTALTHTGVSKIPGGVTVDLAVYLRPADAIDASSDILIGSRADQSVGHLQPGETRLLDVRSRVPAGIADGRYRLVVVADVSEVTSSPGQKVAAVHDQVTQVGSPVALKGVITGHTLPSQVAPGESPAGYVYTTLTNTGAATTAGGSTVDLLVVARPADAGDSAARDIVLGRRDDQAFGYVRPGDSKSFSVRVQVPNDMPRGGYRLLTIIDGGDATGVPGATVLAESAGRLNVGQAVSMVGKTVSHTLPATLESGQRIGGTVTVELTNTGFVQTAAGAGVTLTAVLRPANAGGDGTQDIVVGTRTDKIGYLSPGQAKQLRFWVSVPGQVADGNYRLMTIATMSAPSTNDAMAGATAPASSAASAMLIDGPTIAIGSVPTAGIVETDAKAIARWDVVPFQTIDRPFAVGVVAFHINGIDRVEFTVNGGEPIVAGEMSFNPQSGVEEYWFVLDPAEYPDGELVIDATVHPVLGTPRVLSGAFGGDADNGEYSLVLHANARGSLTRQQITIGPGDSLADALANVADGGEILLRPGVYNIEEMKGWSREFDRWVTIRPADGVDRSDVMIKLDERRVMNVRGSKLHWQNLTFDFSTIRRVYTSRGDVHWFDSVHFFDSNGWAKVYEDGAFQTMHPFATGFITDSRIEDMAYGAAGFELVRNVHMNKISGDAFQQSELIVNSSVNDVDNDIIPQHADVFQYWAPQDTRLLENRIVYNVQGTNLDSQHFFMRTGGGGTFRDFAFVNIDLRRKEGVEPRDRASQLHTTHEHVLFMNVFTEHRMLLRGEGSAAVGEEYLPTDVLFQGSFFNSATMDQIAPWEDVIARDNTIVA